MSFGKDDPPPPPDPRVTSGAQTASNVSTAVANAFLNNMNQNTPLGSLMFNVTDSYNFADPSTGAVYSIPRFTVNQTLGPTQAATQAASEGAKLNLASLAQNKSFQLGSLLGNNIDLSGAPAGGTVIDPILNPSALGLSRPLKFEFGDAGPIDTTYGPADDFSADRLRVEQALYDRLNPQLALERSRTEQQLSDAGIRPGGTAYASGYDNYVRQANDARLAVTARGGEEQQRLVEMARNRALFKNAAQQQQFNQQQSRGQFWNMAEQQAAAEEQMRAAFYNAAIRQRYTEDPATLRQQYLTEQYALRNQPINEISALLSGSQVQQPQFQQIPRSNIPTTDVAGITNQGFQNQLAIWQQQMQQQNQLIGGIFGAAGNIGRGLASGGMGSLFG